MKKKTLLSLAGVLFLSACTSSHYYRGRLYEERGEVLRAAGQYEEYIAGAPRGSHAEQTRVRLGNIYASLNRCEEARARYEAALRGKPLNQPWLSEARIGLMNCPDYFPLGSDRRWVYGDSATLGRDMTLNWKVESSSFGAAAQIQSALYAGKSLIKKELLRYVKKDWAVWEQDGSSTIAVLRYPFVPGRQWRVKLPSGLYVYRVESNDARVKTAAGIFQNCLKVRETNEKLPGSWEYVYYAPSVGRVKTTIGGPGYENPNTELIRYEAKSSPIP
ncbi:MAG: tetratricopeptide repeat protein [Elusimicrobia bacterium]|nr:tetratricopeptide repeat protein [Elusimicrobiota bacterium]MDE2312997.1 tetratricopeptide repeat protein [Elusimicrobiota bacterium]